MDGQVWIQIKSVVFTVVFTGVLTYVLTYVLLKLVDVAMGLRVSAEEESVGLELGLHHNHGYNL